VEKYKSKNKTICLTKIGIMVTITISGTPGSGKSTVAKLLEKKLGIRYVYSGMIFRQLAEEHNMTLEEFGKFCEKNSEIDKKLDERQLEILKKGDVILEGRLSGWLAHLNNIPAFKVAIDTDLETRARRIVKREKGSIQKRKDETLKREVQLGLEEVGRKLRSYLLKKEKKKQRAKRASLLLKNVRPFAESLNRILQADNTLTKKPTVSEIEKYMIAPIEKDIKEDILAILPTNWTPLDEIVEDLGLSNMREKWIIDELILPILTNLEDQNIILKETREEIIEEEVYEEDGVEKRKVKKEKIDYYKLISEIEPIETGIEESAS